MTRLIRSLPFLYATAAFFIGGSYSFRHSVAAQVIIWGLFAALHFYLYLVEKVPLAPPAFLPVLVYLAGAFTSWWNRAPTVALLFLALPLVVRYHQAHYLWYAALSISALAIPGRFEEVQDFVLLILFIFCAAPLYIIGREDLWEHFRVKKKGPAPRIAEDPRFAVEDPYLALITYCERLRSWNGSPFHLRVIEVRGEEGIVIGSEAVFRLTGLLLLAIRDRRPIPCALLLEEKEHIPLLPEYNKRVYIPVNLFEPDDHVDPPEYVIVADARYEGDKQMFADTLPPIREDVIHLLRMAATFERTLTERKRQERLFRGAREILDSFNRERLFNASAWSVLNFVPDAAAVLVTECRDGEHRGIMYRPPEGERGLFPLDTIVPATTGELCNTASVHALMLEGKIGKITEMRDINKRRDRNILFTEPLFSELNRHSQMLALLLQHKDIPQGTLSVFLDTDRELDSQTRTDLSLFARILSSALNNIEMYETVQNLSNVDGLTGLFNRRYLQERLDGMVNEAARSSMPLAVIMLDIDHFKKINDRYGHKAGDEVIRFISRVIRSSVRKVDVAARYGGEEFIVLLHNTTADGAVTVAEKIREIVQGAVVPADGNQIVLTSSFGVSAYPELARSSGDLVKAADDALYESKEHGRNRVTRYTPRST